MRAAEVYESWAPQNSVWSVWAKPIVFTLLDEGLPPQGDGPSETIAPDVSWAPPASQRVAVVVDLPGPEAVGVGLALARRGYRPVPLFNGCHGSSAVIDVAAIVRRLVSAIPEIAECRIGDDAPPVFLLDSRRDRGAPGPGAFDNRWVVLPQDFPSATFLASRGIASAILAERGRTSPRDDLSHVLLRWQEAGMALRLVDDAQPGSSPAPLLVATPSRFRSAVHVLMALAGLRRGSAGGFGALVPVPPPPGSGGGFA